MPMCCRCNHEIPYSRSMRLVAHVRNQYGIYHSGCYGVAKASRLKNGGE